ncbi:hypothetical protein V8E53_002974, partial [Lactarius tabidus]
VKVYAIETLWRFGVGGCVLLGFYGIIGASVGLNPLFPRPTRCRTPIFYSQGFSTIRCAIIGFKQRGNITVTDRSINFAMKKTFFTFQFLLDR